jgi:hypothetical protein
MMGTFFRVPLYYNYLQNTHIWGWQYLYLVCQTVSVTTEQYITFYCTNSYLGGNISVHAR